MKTRQAIGMRGYFFVWLALLALLVLTTSSAYYALGRLNLAISLLVSGAKTAIVIAFCMNVRRESRTTAIFAGAGFFWLTLLIALTLADLFTR